MISLRRGEQPMSISAEERAKLVELARESVAATVTGRALPTVENPKGILLEKRGCFVTLTNRGRLRGCIGTFQPDRPLGEMVVQMGAAAARDPRFIGNPVVSFEVPERAIEVSVLSPLEETQEPEKLELGEHGIYIVAEERSGCFLPEVATDAGWNATEFLDHCCTSKAGLPSGSWKQPDTKVYLFTTEKFDE